MFTTLKFTPWRKWNDRHSFEEAKYPGNYVIAYTQDDLSGKPFTLINDIVYFGMSNSKGGIKSRLDNCDGTLQKPRHSRGHPLARRMKCNYQDYKDTVTHLFVSIWPIKCDVNSCEPKNLRKKGLVTSLEYECLAQFVEKHGRWPEFNNPKSPKC